MTPEDIQNFDALSEQWKITALKNNVLFAAAFHGSPEYWRKTQPALNVLRAEKDNISQELNALLEKYFPHFNR